MSQTSVLEVHRYPSGPPGFEEPLFTTPDSKRAVAEHLLGAPWLKRASEVGERTGEAVHALKEPVRLRVRRGGVEIVRPRTGRCSQRRSRALGVLDHWGEVKDWWDADRHIGRVIFRVFWSGVVADLARERSGGWLLIGVAH